MLCGRDQSGLNAHSLEPDSMRIESWSNVEGLNFSPDINALVTILCILPVTSCTAERLFSGLNCIKTALRSTMSNERLSNLTLLHLHLDIPIDIEEVIDKF